MIPKQIQPDCIETMFRCVFFLNRLVLFQMEHRDTKHLTRIIHHQFVKQNLLDVRSAMDLSRENA